MIARFWFCGRSSGKSSRGFFKDAANSSPSPGGEGRGEDGRCNKFLSLLTGLSWFSARCTASHAATGVIFSGQNFCRAQSQNCETKKTHARPARKTGGDSGAEIELGHMSRRKTYDGEKHLQVLANELARANTHFYFGKKLLENYQQLGAAKDFWDYTLAAYHSIALLNLCRVYDFHKHGINLFNCLKSIDEKVLDQAKRNPEGSIRTYPLASEGRRHAAAYFHRASRNAPRRCARH